MTEGRGAWPTPERCCQTCAWFADFSGEIAESEPGEPVNGYCTRDLYHNPSNEYGGFWTGTACVCPKWERGRQ